MAVTGAALLQQQLTTPEARANWQRWVAALPPAPTVPTLGPMGEAQYFANQNAINQDFATQKAQSLFGQGQAEADFAERRSDLARRFMMMRQKMPYSFTARGLMGSGLWRDSLRTLNDDRTRAFGQLGRQRSGAVGQFVLGRQQLVSDRDRRLAELDAARLAAQQQRSLGSLNMGVGQ